MLSEKQPTLSEILKNHRDRWGHLQVRCKYPDCELCLWQEVLGSIVVIITLSLLVAWALFR